MNNRVKCIESPYGDIGYILKVDGNFTEFFKENHDLANYDLAQMIPKVTYVDNFIVCHYLKDDKLYYINEEDVVEVEVMEVLEYNENWEVIKENGESMSEDELLDRHNGEEYCCGEADDMTCYVYFK
jgi:hypothetical protein